MSTPSTEHEKIAYSDHVDLEGGAPLGRAVTYQLSESQFEKLYLQPGGAQAKGDLTKRFGNPTALGVASFLLCLTPFSCELMGWAGTTSAASLTLTGASYFVGGGGLFVSGLLEWILGNTFSFLVFTTFGTFWAAFGFLIQPSQMIATALGGAATNDYNSGIAVYLIWWALLVLIYLVASLRTNVVFVLLFTFLEINFWFLIVAYLKIGQGNFTNVVMLLKASGAFGFLCASMGWYLLAVLVWGSTGIPLALPVGDLSGFLAGPKPKAT